MAKFTINISKDLQDMLNDIGKGIDTIAPMMINEAAPIVVKSIQGSLQGHRDTGDLIRSIKAGKAKKIKNGGYYGSINFVGYSDHKYYGRTVQTVPNDVKAMGLEYGSSNEPAKPFLTKAVNDVEGEVNDRMQEVFNREIENI